MEVTCHAPHDFTQILPMVGRPAWPFLLVKSPFNPWSKAGWPHHLAAYCRPTSPFHRLVIGAQIDSSFPGGMPNIENCWQWLIMVHHGSSWLYNYGWYWLISMHKPYRWWWMGHVPSQHGFQYWVMVIHDLDDLGYPHFRKSPDRFDIQTCWDQWKG